MFGYFKRKEVGKPIEPEVKPAPPVMTIVDTTIENPPPADHNVMLGDQRVGTIKYSPDTKGWVFGPHQFYEPNRLYISDFTTVHTFTRAEMFMILEKLTQLNSRSATL